MRGLLPDHPRACATLAEVPETFLDLLSRQLLGASACDQGADVLTPKILRVFGHFTELA